VERPASYNQRPTLQYQPGDRPVQQPGPIPPLGHGIATGRLWATGLATAAVAALATVVVTMLIRGVLNVPVFAPRGAGVWGNATTGYLAALAALAALVATGVLHLLLMTVARPRAFFATIITLVTAAMILLPFTSALDTSAKVASAAVSLVVGVTIGGLLSSAIPGVAPGRAYSDM
jgi:Family of unknown function (DUF6069)